jgi:DNA-directed RNA polymerase specialized sigma24 family protein
VLREDRRARLKRIRETTPRGQFPPLRELGAIEDPQERYRRATEEQERLAALSYMLTDVRAKAVRSLTEEPYGYTWREIGALLDLSFGMVQKLVRVADGVRERGQ